MANTSIEWTDKVWNPVTGCTKVSAGCKNCYAERMMGRNLPGMTQKFTDVVCHPERLETPLHWRKPSRIFVNSMSDLFHKDVPDEFILSCFQEMASISRHTYQILTKRPERARSLLSRIKLCDPGLGWMTLDGENPVGYGGKAKALFNPHTWPLPNVWLGVSVENQETADHRIPLLLQTPAAVRFVSYEPALGPVNFMGVRVDCNSCPDGFHGIDALEGHNAPAKLDWVICGGESGPGARPMHPDWARSVRDQCKEAGVPFFFKQWGEWLPFTQDTPHKDASYTQSTAVMHEGGTCSADLMAIPPATAKGTIYGCGRVGKKAAGCLLDGVEHKEFPVAGKERG